MAGAPSLLLLIFLTTTVSSRSKTNVCGGNTRLCGYNLKGPICKGPTEACYGWFLRKSSSGKFALERNAAYRSTSIYDKDGCRPGKKIFPGDVDCCSSAFRPARCCHEPNNKWEFCS